MTNKQPNFNEEVIKVFIIQGRRIDLEYKIVADHCLLLTDTIFFFYYNAILMI